MSNSKEISYIKDNQWFFGVKRDDSLFSYSIRFNGQKKHMREYGLELTETIYIPSEDDFPMRVFNSQQSREFHSESLKRISENPLILSEFIDRDYATWDEIFRLCQVLKEWIGKEDYENSIKAFEEIVGRYEYHGLYFYIIFSLGMMLTKNVRDIKDEVSNIVEVNNSWRNEIPIKEKKMDEALDSFFKFIILKKGLKLSVLELTRHLTVEELTDFIRNKVTEKEICNLITKRIKNGLIFLGLRDSQKCQIIDGPEDVSEIKDSFIRVEDLDEKLKQRELKGDVAYAYGNIRGLVLVIRDIQELEEMGDEVRDKILVITQTTPEFIPYLKDIKAIVTDEGGILCHAAIISREMKLPCIVGTEVATKILKNNDLIEIDGRRGIIKKVQSR